MRVAFHCCVIVWAIFGSLVWPLIATAQSEIVPATDRPQPKSPEESAKCAALPPGFRLDIVAAEPLIRSPSAIAFDEQGRLFVCEIHGYNLDGYLDILELNKTGKLDREVRRVRHASPANQAAAHLEMFGTVKLLTDTNGDGVMDKADVWADRLPPCYGVIPSRSGVIVICAPDIVYLADRDGDGTAEFRETLYTGFARELIERGMSNPRQGPDNWIYVAAGGGGGTITGAKLSKPVVIGHTDFRFRPDGSSIEPVTGRESMFGLAMTDFGDRFHTIVTYVSPLPYHYLARNPFVQSPPDEVGIEPTRKLFPISQPDPWRKVRGADPEWIKFYGEAETLPNGQFTSSSGQMIYRSKAWPEPYRGNYFVCDPANNLVHRCLLEQRGAGYAARIAPENNTTEFLASTDQWFRPINLSTGPDGQVYIVDMYREIIEDFSAIPRFLQQQYSEALVAGENHGRIWRLSHGEARPGAKSERLDRATNDELVEFLDHANPWQRETAQRLLIEGGQESVRATLASHVRHGKTPQGRMHALYTLEGLSLLEPADVIAGMQDAHGEVRRHAVQLSDRWLDDLPQVLEQVLARIDDSEPRVRIQAALSLGESRSPSAVAGLAKLAVEHGAEDWMPAAITSSLAESADSFLERILAAKRTPGAVAILSPVAETIGAKRDPAAVGRGLQSIAGIPGDDARNLQLALLTGLSRGLERGKSEPLQSESIVQGIERLLESPSPEVAETSVRVAGLLKLADSPVMRRAWENAGRIAADENRPLAARLAAVSLLSVAPWPQPQALRELLGPRQPTELQFAVVKAFSRADRDDVMDGLLGNLSGLAPKVQEAVIDACFARHGRLKGLLDAVEADIVSPTAISALRREQLTEHGNPDLRRRARNLFSRRMNDERAEVIKQYQSALTMVRDPKRGEQVYLKTCAPCHKLGDAGYEVGPDLLAVRTRPDESLLLDILDPSSALARGYTVYAVTTAAGRVHTGVLASDSATSITLRNAAVIAPRQSKPAAAEETILRIDIEEMKALTKSLMPDGLEKELKPQDVADLLGFLRHSLGPARAGVVLFEDAPDFLAALVEGNAKASLTSDDKQSGDAALRLAEGQRHSPRIAGWNYRIVEQPASAEKGYRYLRFAWKSVGAQGVLIELAADGSWPPANQPMRRYYSGVNSSGWAATQVSPDVPQDWTIVTVDLWKDFGEFNLTGIAPTALGGPALFDKIELLPTLPE